MLGFAGLVVVGSSSLLGAAPSQQGEQDRPVGLSVVVVDVGQGDSLVVRSPDGLIHAFDGGPDGAGAMSTLPAIDSMQPLGYGFALLSHFHTDHHGGLDEVLQRPFQLVYDRGDVRRPSNQATQSYLNAAGSRRRTIIPGQVLDLGAGVTLRCVAVNGQVDGGGGLNPTGATQEENARSVAVRLDYGDFSMWIGGDLTGGGNGTPDVESPASLSCGDVDVYKVNHHGSNTSTSNNLVNRLQPELAIVSAGVGNPYGHPTTGTTNRLAQAAALRTMLCTTRGSSNLIGFAAVGNLRIDTDGRRYRATAQNGDFLDFYVDEVAPALLAPGDVKITELHRNPGVVPDSNGEYIEVQATGSRPLALSGMQLSDNGSTVILSSNLMLLPGRPLLFQIDGNKSRNGGQPLGVPLPFSSIALANTADTVALGQSGTVVDQVAYGSGFVGGSGVAAERRDLYGSGAQANFGAAPQTFGAGDRGSPGQRNALDISAHPVSIDVEVSPTELILRATALSHPGKISAIGVAYGTSPGMSLFGAVIPLNFDSLLQTFLAFPGMLGPMPAGGYRSLHVPLPQSNPLQGVSVFAAHAILDAQLLVVSGVSSPFSFVFP